MISCRYNIKSENDDVHDFIFKKRSDCIVKQKHEDW